MAQGDKFNIYLLDVNGHYYEAVPVGDGTWTITLNVSSDPLANQLFIKNLPIDWDKTQIDWERNTTYYGIFRSLSTEYKFVLDARAILLSLYSANNTQAFCTMRIDVLNEDNNSGTPTDVWKYDVFYESQIDFGELKDDKRQHILTASTLDSKLFALLKANASKNFNIPLWLYNSGSATWAPAPNTEFVYHTGCKVFWSNNYISGATASSPIAPQSGGDLYGFNHGSVSDARHWIPPLNQYNIVQNNGTTTFLGNDLLQPLLIQQNQAYNYNRNFEGTDDIQAYSKNRGLIKNLLKNPTETDPVNMTFFIDGVFDHITTTTLSGYTAEFIGIVLFEIDNLDKCAEISGNYTYQMLYQQNIPSGGGTIGPIPFSAVVTANLRYDKAYVMGIIYDDVLTGISGVHVANVALTALQLRIDSTHNGGTGTPSSLNAPRTPFSVFPAMRAVHVWENLVKVIDSIGTDPYGFPTGGGAFTGNATILNQSFAFVDLIPKNLMFTSENALRQVAGQPYLTVSVQDFFSTMFKIMGVGLGMSSISAGLPFDSTKLTIADLAKFFDWQTEVYNLQDNVANFTIEPLTTIKGDNIKAGYGSPQTNNNYGVDSFLIPTEYATQLINTPKDIDLSVSSVMVDQNEIEKARAQSSTREQSNPSAKNGLALLEVRTTASAPVDVVDPSGALYTVTPFPPKTYPTAQSTDPTAATDPYVRGLYYPETAMNLSLTPASNLLRLGYFLDGLTFGTSKLIFRKQYQMQYNNTPILFPGIAHNIGYGLIQEVADIPLPIIASDPNNLFRPDLFTVETKTPVNLYSIINGNPYGVIKFTWINPYTGVQTQYKGFIWKVSQKVGNNASTTITLLASPKTTDADINAA